MNIKEEPIHREETPEDALGEYTETHPAFGQIQISRVSSGGRVALYGANSSLHPTSIMISIKKSRRCHDLSHDWTFGGKELIEIEMTQLQFADMLTSFNMGEGVPCTLRHVKGERIPRIAVEDDTEISRIKEGFREKVREKLVESDVENVAKEVDEILSKKSINKGDKDRLRSIVGRVSKFLGDSVPFVMDQFVESAEKVESEIKKEVAAFTQLVVENSGMKALSELAPEDQARLLRGEIEAKEPLRLEGGDDGEG